MLNVNPKGGAEHKESNTLHISSIKTPSIPFMTGLLANLKTGNFCILKKQNTPLFIHL